MAGRAEVAHGTDRASRVQKYDGLPENGRLIDDGIKKPKSMVPVMGSFVSTLEQQNGVEMNPVLAASQFGDAQQKPKFMAKITILDSHSDDNF